MNHTNKNTAEKLIARYENIASNLELETLLGSSEEYKVFKKKEILNAINQLTGFGSLLTCTMCHDAKYNCTNCVYSSMRITPKQNGHYCCSDELQATYMEICNSLTIKDLKKALINRANAIKEFLQNTGESDGKE